MAAPMMLSVSVLFISLVALGVYDVLKNVETNGCEMTYMFQYPKYKEIEIPELKKDFPHYGLQIYGEGSYMDQISSNLRLQGIPVLFIPGNAGSYKQVRSLGSVALRKSEDRQDNVHFNYFVADFNEELAALNGGTLRRQTEFVVHCVKKILSLYKTSSSPPKSVVLVGHSMGGFIARALFTFPGFDPLSVNTIITQATPHRRLYAFADGDLDSFYKTVNKFWMDEAQGVVRHVTVVSTGGGLRDILIRYDQTPLDGIVAEDRGISASTTSVPKAWVSTDHLCSVWCRQMVLLTKRALFDTIDPKTSQISEDPELRMKVFRHHFLHNNGMPNYLSHKEKQSISLDSKITWETKLEKTWIISSKKMKEAKYVAMPVLLEENKDSVLLMTNMTNPEWVCYCEIPSGMDRCTSCTSLSEESNYLPPLYSNNKYLGVRDTSFNATLQTYIVIIIPAKAKTVSIFADRYNSNERHLVYQMPNVYDSIISYPISATDGAAMLKISNASVFYSLHLAGLSLPISTYTAKVVPFGCSRHHAEMNEGSILRLRIPWSNEDTYSFAGYGKEASLPIKLQTGRPADYDWRLDASEPHLEMFLHPKCHYQLRLIAATQDGLGQAVRFYGVLLPAFFLAVWILTLRGVIVRANKGQASSIGCPADCLVQFAKPYYVIPVLMVVRAVISFGPVAKLIAKMGIPAEDSVSLSQQSIWFRVLPVFLYVTAWLFSYVHAYLVQNFLQLYSYCGRIFHCLPEAILDKLSILHLGISVLSILSTFLCGSLGVVISFVLVLFRVIHIYYTIGLKLDTKETHLRLSFFFSIMMVLFWACILCLAILAVWIKQLSIHQMLEPLSSDPTRLPGFILALCITVLLKADDAIFNRPPKEITGWLLYVLSILVLLFAMESVYRLPSFTACVVALVSIEGVISLLSKNSNSKED